MIMMIKPLGHKMMVTLTSLSLSLFCIPTPRNERGETNGR